MKQLIYKNPKTGRLSVPIDESDTSRRAILERAKWMIDRVIGGGDADAITQEQGVSESDVVPAHGGPIPGIRVLGLSPRLEGILVEAGYRDVDDLVEASAADLLAIKGVGKGALRVIGVAITRYGIDEALHDERTDTDADDPAGGDAGHVPDTGVQLDD